MNSQALDYQSVDQGFNRVHFCMKLGSVNNLVVLVIEYTLKLIFILLWEIINFISDDQNELVLRLGLLEMDRRTKYL